MDCPGAGDGPVYGAHVGLEAGVAGGSVLYGTGVGGGFADGDGDAVGAGLSTTVFDSHSESVVIKARPTTRAVFIESYFLSLSPGVSVSARAASMSAIISTCVHAPQESHIDTELPSRRTRSSFASAFASLSLAATRSETVRG